MVAASILPVTIVNNEIYFLFGKENAMEDSAKGFSDFGGGVEKGETIIKTALREGAEELSGFLGDPKQLKLLINKNGGFYKVIHDSYHVHIFFLEYDENLPQYFTNHHRFVWNRMDKNMLNNSKFFEKQEIKWFSIKELKTSKHEFREFYRKIVDLFLEDISNIEKFIKEKREKREKKEIEKKRFSKSSKKNITRKIMGGQ